jgi:hypothetical protein
MNSTQTFSKTDIEAYPMVEALFCDINCEGINMYRTHDEIVELVRRDFDKLGPFQFAKQWGYLINGSGEELAMQWMAYFNAFTGSSHY